MSEDGRTTQGTDLYEDDPAKPSIRQLLDDFLHEQEGRLSPRTYQRYERVVHLLGDCLEEWGPRLLPPEERRPRPSEREAAEEASFLDRFGAERILPMYGELFGGYLHRDDQVPQTARHAAAAVTRKLARWLAARGHVETSEVEYWNRRAERAARDLVASREIADLLRKHEQAGEGSGEPVGTGGIEGSFRVGRVLQGRVWLEDEGGEEIGPLRLPVDLASRLLPGWRIEGVLDTAQGGCGLIEVRGLHPA